MLKKLYQVKFALIEDGLEHLNHDSMNVVAISAEAAIKKAGKRKNCFVSDVIMISTIDRS